MNVYNDGAPMLCRRVIGDAGAHNCDRPADYLVVDRFGVGGRFGPEGRIAIIPYCERDVDGMVHATTQDPYRRLIAVVRL